MKKKLWKDLATKLRQIKDEKRKEREELLKKQKKNLLEGLQRDLDKQLRNLQEPL